MNPDPSSKKIHLEIRINATNPLLLEGLETWLKLGLINEAQVRKISQQYLSCSLPIVKSVSAVDSLQVVKL